MTTPAPCGQCLPVIDELLAQPFPAAATTDDTGHAGPDHKVRDLRISQDFWDDEDGQAWDQAHADLEACLDDLTHTLTTRWGDPLAVDLWAWLTAGLNGDLNGQEVSEPVAYLSQNAMNMRAWQLPGGAHWLGLALGQADKELPLVLYAAIGTGPVPQTPS
ncbi:hypothetical protein [Streptomyces venezuelae]|uniref:hypothetical protein n=1 Tax=Streptomyces venezuelae TaxID=54571 RepID=UPI00331DC0E8